jgi:dTDP-4-amino-4,6-dideoxygalactose transaminase
MSRDAWRRYTEHGDWRYDVAAQGFKYNLSDIQSAIGIHQLRKLDRFVTTRAQYAKRYHRLLGDLDTVELPPDNSHCRHAWHLYIIRLRLDRLTITRDQVIRELHAAGIGTSVHFIPVPIHRFFSTLPLASYACPEALTLYQRIVSLPLYPAMTIEQIDYVARTVRSILDRGRRPGLFAPVLRAAVEAISMPDPCPEGAL